MLRLALKRIPFHTFCRWTMAHEIACFTSSLEPHPTRKRGSDPVSHQQLEQDMAPAHTPAPLARFIEIDAAAQAARRRWRDDANVQHRVALALCLVESPPRELVERLRAAAQEIGKGSSAFSPLRGALRFAVAAMTLQADLRPSELLPALEETRLRFREARIKRGATSELIARVCLVLEGAAARTGLVPSFDRVRRLQHLMAEMKQRHSILTNVERLPVATLLSALPQEASELASRAEIAYAALRGWNHGHRSQLHTAAHVLGLTGGDMLARAERLSRLWWAGKSRNLRMTGTDLLPLALLALTDGETEDALIDRVLQEREAIRALRPRPQKQLAFELATGTVFMSQSIHGEPIATGRADLTGMQTMMAVHALLVAQSGAALAAASGGAAAAG